MDKRVQKLIWQSYYVTNGASLSPEGPAKADSSIREQRLRGGAYRASAQEQTQLALVGSSVLNHAPRTAPLRKVS